MRDIPRDAPKAHYARVLLPTREVGTGWTAWWWSGSYSSSGCGAPSTSSATRRYYCNGTSTQVRPERGLRGSTPRWRAV